jgi:antitoxin (DNA-binding transcriptional repressor) of toxin-antitoxin stability system
MSAMIQVDERDAVDQWDALLDRIAGGVSIEILRRGRPIARLASVPAVSVADVNDAIHKLRALRATTTLSPLQFADARDEGRS